MIYSYEYVDDYNRALTRCPSCNSDLTDSDNVIVHLSIGESSADIYTYLRSDGTLVDVDNAVANGYHAGTRCARCDAGLSDYEVQVTSD